jgi:hypothetical protein
VHVWRLVLDEARAHPRLGMNPQPFAVEHASCRRPVRDGPSGPVEERAMRSAGESALTGSSIRRGGRPWIDTSTSPNVGAAVRALDMGTSGLEGAQQGRSRGRKQRV